MKPLRGTGFATFFSIDMNALRGNLDFRGDGDRHYKVRSDEAIRCKCTKPCRVKYNFGFV
jgi:hypothetical protein